MNTTEIRSPIDAKSVAALRAAEAIKNGMRVGLGSGSTAELFIAALGARVEGEQLDIAAVATSRASAECAERVGIALSDLSALGALDIAVDGADEIDPDLNLIKGGGGALLREKIVAQAANCRVIIADSSKLVDRLGAFSLPVEVIAFGWQATVEHVLDACRSDQGHPAWHLRVRNGDRFLTDHGNLIVDVDVGVIDDPGALGDALSRIAGVVEHGIFVDMCELAIIGHGDGRAEYFGDELDVVAEDIRDRVDG